MKLYGLLGHKIGYSLSPAMHNAAFKKMKLKAVYKIFDVKPESFDAFLKGILRSNISGLNVTVPYKQEAFKFLERYGTLEEETEKLGAVNTIAIKNKSLFGYNTDTIGFVESLKKDLQFNPRMKNILIFGAGGAGSVCALRLARVAKKINICDIENNRLKLFKSRFFEYFGKKKLNIIKNKKEDIDKVLGECQLLVNATPFGRKSGEMLVSPDSLHKNLRIFDLIYKPEETPLLKAAHKLGIKAINGLGMLLYQGAASFELWTGRKAPIETMREALENGLKNQKSKIKN